MLFGYISKVNDAGYGSGDMLSSKMPFRAPTRFVNIPLKKSWTVSLSNILYTYGLKIWTLVMCYFADYGTVLYTVNFIAHETES
jgi:hypothetical protein